MSTNLSSKHNWEAIIAEYEKSGLPQKEFCLKNNISLGRFGYHKGLIKGKQQIPNKKSSLFSAIQIQKNEPKIVGEIKILLPNGFQCLFPSTIDPSQIKPFIEALLSC